MTILEFIVGFVLISIVWDVLTILGLRSKPLFYVFVLPWLLLGRAIHSVIAWIITGLLLLHQRTRPVGSDHRETFDDPPQDIVRRGR